MEALINNYRTQVQNLFRGFVEVCHVIGEASEDGVQYMEYGRVDSSLLKNELPLNCE